MAAYSILLIAALLGTIIEIFYSAKYSTPFFILISILFILVGGLTKNGLDYDAYVEIFKYPISFNDVWSFGQFEPLFLISCSIFPSYQCFLFFYVILNWIFISKAIIKDSPYICISIFVYITTYYILGLMGQLRQALAISLMISAWHLPKGKLFPLIIIASLIHYSAVICLLIYIIPNKLLNCKYYFFAVVLALIAYFALQEIVSNLLINISELEFSSTAMGKFSLYAIGSTESPSGSILFLIYKIYIVILLLWKKTQFQKNQLFPKLFNMYILSIILWAGLSFSGTLGGRLALYFSITEIFLIPFLIKAYHRTPIGIAICFSIVVCCIYQFYSLISDLSVVLLPYKSILS